ncbi:MAG: glutathione S-transferase [Alphaproteobacteria bacterium]|nr:glutathione S-transferase [Alphaproteobacteria bacterium]
MLTVHHLRNSQSERIVWLCEELGIDYELKVWNRREDNMMAPDEYKALHPIQSAPIITDGDFSLGESGAIVEYICGRYADWKLCPRADDLDFAQHLFWFHFTNGTFMTNVMMDMAVMMAGAQAQAGIGSERGERAWAMIEEQLDKTDWFGGRQLTSADVMMVFGLTTLRSFMGKSLDGLTNLRAYLQRVGARPAYQRAMARAEPGIIPNLT